MLVPIRCITCGRPLAHLYDKFRERIEAGEEPRKVLDELGVESMCCRVTLMTSVDRMKEITRFKP